ncbi:hypothetical protein P691DRAFT_680270 [Macrolepiota fuliginosa MF-IS2]|uniref:Reverse transcriptase zinc-binding domain-containing protein n=1 Tax=Macrolepiota fuliginosa MF-IS2 TaxID=1400762 RepID=A0A9P6BWM7_9AGAR|nr:hypothetical protein P691DRAFT_680270 [Macrolepiota fuliginosa MF-IS2]
MKIIQQLLRQNRVILMQLRLGYIPLNAYLHRFKKRDNPTCRDCGKEEEMVEHYLLHYKGQREKMEKNMGRERLTKKTTLSMREGWEALFKYVNSTERFKDYPRMRKVKIKEKGEVEIGT